MADLRDQLQGTLRGTYTIERELGGGGMSRVFVAEELRLKRKVVVKVLPAELAAGISAERFEREIQLAASLQQANIVPVLTAGDTNGLPYFTMPYVEGESLRTRLGQGNPLAITEVISILRDVARALAYAHERAVVHRDIKPDNVLLSGGAAVVTDFGIAKALSASRTESGRETLTQNGTSIGTPAYMSPEQAAGDPAIDHRADIYAFGCTAYELLAGKPPFAEGPPQRILAAQMGKAPAPIAGLRPDSPAALSRLVMECLAKEPAARPQRAADLVVALDTVTSMSGVLLPDVLLGGRALLVRALMIYAAAFILVAALARAALDVIGLPDWVFPGALIVMALGLPVVLLTGYVQRTTIRALAAAPPRTSGGSAVPRGTMESMALRVRPHMSWRRTALGGAWAVGAFVLLVGVFMFMRAFGIGPAGSLIGAGKLADQDQILLIDFKVSGPDSASTGAFAGWMRESVQNTRSVRLMSATAVAGSLQRMKLPRDTAIDFDLAQILARREGIKAILTGEVTPLGGGTVVTARLRDASSGAELWSGRRVVPNSNQYNRAFDELGRELRGKIGESLKDVRASPPLARVTTSSLAALEKFTEGSRLTDVEGKHTDAFPLLREAIHQDTTFAMAYRKLAVAMRNNNLGRDSIAPVLEAGLRYIDRLPDAERLAYLGEYYYDGGSAHQDRKKAAENYEELFRSFPEWKTIITATQLGNIYSERREYARAESVYIEIKRIAPEEISPYLNVIGDQVIQRRFPQALQSLAEAAARTPRVPGVSGARAAVWYVMGWADSVRDFWARSKANPGLAHGQLAALSLREGRLAEWRRELGVVDSIRAAQDSGTTPASKLNRLLDASHVELTVRDDPEKAAGMIEAAVRSEGASREPGQRLRIVTQYAMAGRADSARVELARYNAIVTDSAPRRIARNARQAAEAWIAVADGRYQDAIKEFRQSDLLPDGPASGCAICLDPAIGHAFMAASLTDSAIAVFEHFVNTPNYGRLGRDSYDLARILRELGALYATKGDKANAVKYYQQFIDLWKKADTELQHFVVDAKRRVADLRNTDRPK